MAYKTNERQYALDHHGGAAHEGPAGSADELSFEAGYRNFRMDIHMKRMRTTRSPASKTQLTLRSELLTWVKSGRADFEDEGEVRAGKDCLRGMEFRQQVFDALIVSRLREMGERDGQGVTDQVRGEISLGIENLESSRKPGV